MSFSFEELAKEAEELNDKDIKELPTISKVSFNYSSVECNQVLQERIIGESDSYLSQLVEKLGNSDWVRNGLKYSDGENCPFCQQPLNDELKRNIRSLFSNIYEDKISELETLYNTYQHEINNLKKELSEPIFSMPHIAKHDSLFDKIASYTAILETNLNLIRKKLANPSEVVCLIDSKGQLESVNGQIELIQNEVSDFNKKLQKRDELLSNIRVRFWQILKNEFQSAIELNNLSKAAINTSLDNLRTELTNKRAEKKSKEVKLSELRSRTTDITTSVININRRLQSLGVTGFSLKASKESSALYYIARSDNDCSNIFRSLSEGEKTLITFLYFLEKCSGASSKEENAISSIRTIVIDDPISSLSQNYVFDIASIIHNEIIEKDFKQIFILTHNLYFFHELLMLKNPNKAHNPKGYNLYRIIKSENTNIIPMDRHTLLNDYQNYWQMIKDCSEGNLHVSMLPNAMRNILERYFGFIHQKDNLNKALNKVGSLDKEFQPLLRYFNRGSHSDSINLDLGTIDTERYINKFKEIFQETGFIEHFNTMMAPNNAN